MSSAYFVLGGSDGPELTRPGESEAKTCRGSEPQRACA